MTVKSNAVLGADIIRGDTVRICLRKNKSKQNYVWIDSIFEAQIICFGSEIAGLLDHSYDKCALVLKT